MSMTKASDLETWKITITSELHCTYDTACSVPLHEILPRVNERPIALTNARLRMTYRHLSPESVLVDVSSVSVRGINPRRVVRVALISHSKSAGEHYAEKKDGRVLTRE